jgi:acyl CoA:acetate/3-ketoacid CoA transferase beta subunit
VIIGMQNTTSEGKSQPAKHCGLLITGFAEADMVVAELIVFALGKGGLWLGGLHPR